MDYIRIGDLTIRGINQSIRIEDLEIDIEANCHAEAKITVLIDGTVDSVYLKADQVIYVMEREHILFAGKIHSVLKENPFSQRCCIYLISCSSNLDLVRRKKSYQNIQLNVNDILEKCVCMEKGRFSYFAQLCNFDMPMIQYDETAWEFACRMASRINSVIYPQYLSGENSFSVGMSNDAIIRKIEVEEISYLFDKAYWAKVEGNIERQRKDYVSYKIESYENCEIGDELVVDGKNLGKVLLKKVFVKNAIVQFCYLVGPEYIVRLPRYNNKKLAGLSIRCEVIDVSKEMLKLKMEFDKEQAKNEAYDYSWVPETGNQMYLMPKVGSTVNLYFSNETEESAIAVSCISEGDGSGLKANTNSRYLTNDYGRQMKLMEDSMGFINSQNGDGVEIIDGGEISLQSSMNITMVSMGAININSNSFLLETPNEFILQKVRL